MNDTSLIGRTLAGKFKILSHIGEGGMATVYRGTWDGEPSSVALKVMNPELARDHKFVRRFRREAKAASMLKHPNTVAIVEFGVDAELVYMAMECLEGQDLSFLLHRDRRIPEARAARILIQVCAALAEAHRQNIVHRDLKPDNVMLIDGEDGENEQVKVLDFGIAKILDDAEDAQLADPRAEPASSARSLLTRVGTIVGTPAYMSPEQGRAEAVDARTDLYSCGVLLYELVTGRVPFDGETPMQVVMRHVNEPPMPPGQLVPMHPGFEALIMKALAKFAAQRHQTADEMATALRQLLPELATERRVRKQASAKVELHGAAAAPPAAANPMAPAAQPDAWAKPAPPGPVLDDDDDDDAPTGVVNLPPVPPMKAAAPAKPAPFPTLVLGLPEDLPDIPTAPPAASTGHGTPTPSTITRPHQHILESTKASEGAAEPAAPPPTAPAAPPPPPPAAPPPAPPAAARPAVARPAPPPTAPAAAPLPPDDDDDEDEPRTLIADPKPPPARPAPPTARGPLAPPEGTPTGTIPVGGGHAAPPPAPPPPAAPPPAPPPPAPPPPAPPPPAPPPAANKPIKVPGKGGNPFADTIASAVSPTELPNLVTDKTEPSRRSADLVGNLIAAELDGPKGNLPNLDLPPVPVSPTGTIPVGTSRRDLGVGKPIVIDAKASGLDSTQKVPTDASSENKRDAASIQLTAPLPVGAPLTFSQEPKVQVETLAAQLPQGSPRAPTELRAKPPPALWQPRKVKARPKWVAPVAVVLGVLLGALLFVTVIFIVKRLGP